MAQPAFTVIGAAEARFNGTTYAQAGEHDGRPCYRQNGGGRGTVWYGNNQWHVSDELDCSSVNSGPVHPDLLSGSPKGGWRDNDGAAGPSIVAYKSYTMT